jgi:cytoskeletal protein CcmA (bactofilin family)
VSNNLDLQSTNFIAEGTVINGTFETTSNVRLDGVIKGNIKCNGKVIMGKKGSINGDIESSESAIEGRYEGNLQVKDTLHVYATANLNGTFKAGKLIVDEGGIINGDCQVSGTK